MSGDATLDDVCEAFFAEGERIASDDDDDPLAAADAWHMRKMTPAARARRAHLARYVRWTVGAAAALLVLGIMIDTVRKNQVETVTTYPRSAP
jgi:hypothetical protein